MLTQRTSRALRPHGSTRRAVAPLTLAGCAFAGCAFLAGCGIATSGAGTSTAPAQSQTPGVISGHVHGGNQPVGGSSIYLFAVSANGYGQPAASLLSGANVATDGNGNGYVTTDGSGNFNITGDYNCPSSTSLVYVLASGGNPGLVQGTNNQSLKLAATLGNCANVKANAATTFIDINELTTVAMAYALGGFMTSATNAGASSTNLTGIANAFVLAQVLVTTANGSAQTATPGGNGVVPQAELNTLGNIIASCVSSNGAVTGPSNPSACYALFAATTINGAVPADTLQAVLNIAHHPGSNVSGLAALVGAQAPFQPALISLPSDWTVALTFTGGGIHTPQAVAIDASGNAWIANSTNVITELSATAGSPPSGASGFTATGLDAPVSLAIDTAGDVWIANCGDTCSGSGNASSVTELAANGQSSSNYTSSGFNGAYAVALSGTNQAWVANALGSSLTQLSSAGSTLIAADIAADLIYPVSVAVDAGGNALTVSPADNAIAGFTSSGLADTADAYQGSALNYPYAVAIDNNHNLWVANHGNNTVTELGAGALVGTGPFSGGGITTPVAIALDGAGNAWVANTSNSLSEISNAGAVLSPGTGLGSGLVYPDGLAVDGSGNVWVTSCGHYCQPSSASQGSISELVGAATPVVTPLAVGAATNRLAAQP